MMQVQNNIPQVYKTFSPSSTTSTPASSLKTDKPVQASAAAPVYYAPVSSTKAQQYNTMAASSVYTTPAIVKGKKPNLIDSIRSINKVNTAKTTDVAWNNDLRELFQKNQAIIYALVMRTFNAKDVDGDGLIDNPKAGEHTGTFINAIDRLDELKGLGVNTIHMLPINPPGKEEAMGIAGSLYAPSDFLSIDPKLYDPSAPGDVKDQAKQFIKECHKRNIRVMVDLPSCASLDLYDKHKELMAIDENGNPKVPQGWDDIRMLDPTKKEVMEMHKKYVDMCLDLGIDGIRADVARAKPAEFWSELTNYARSKNPDFAFLAESYTYEDASPMLNMPKDRPEDLLRAGFDSYYGQYHIFHEMKTSKDFHDNMILNLEMSQKLPPNKSLIGSFATHDDKSPMSHGGVSYCNLTTGIQTTLPMTNPYFITGFESGDDYNYSYKDKISPDTDTDSHKCEVHSEMLDIFNYSRKPGGTHPEVGNFMKDMINVRKQYEDVITKGSYIPLATNNKDDQIVAYARHLGGKTLLIIANKDVNARETGEVVVPGLKSNQHLKDLAPSYGVESQYGPTDGGVMVDLGPARFHMFEIDDNDIEKLSEHVYKQKLDPKPAES